jgi:hypothetical protein
MHQYRPDMNTFPSRARQQAFLRDGHNQTFLT